MNHAKESDYKEIQQIFYQYKEWFPHIRADYIKRKILAEEVIFENDVIITYNIYKKKTRLGNITANAGDCILHQIAAKERNGSASEVLNRFFDYINTDVYLCVRADNKRAIKFYNKFGMKEISDILWAKGTLPGKVFIKQLKNNLETFMEN